MPFKNDATAPQRKREASHVLSEWALVSVVINTRNRKAKLRHALASVARQDYQPIEVIVGDDGSNDGTSELVTTEFSDVRLHRFAEPVGIIAARNFLIGQVANGEVLVVLDDDAVFLDPTAISRAIRRMRRDSRIAVVAFGIEDETGQISGLGENAGYTGVFSGGASAMNRSVFQSLGGYPEIFGRQSEETYLAIRLIERGLRIFYAPEVRIRHPRGGGGSIDIIAHFGARNRILLGAMIEPFPWVMISVGGSLLRQLVWAIKRGLLLHVIGGVYAGLSAVPWALRRRRPVPWTAISAFRGLRATSQADSSIVESIYKGQGRGSF